MSASYDPTCQCPDCLSLRLATRYDQSIALGEAGTPAITGTSTNYVEGLSEEWLQETDVWSRQKGPRTRDAVVHLVYEVRRLRSILDQPKPGDDDLGSLTLSDLRSVLNRPLHDILLAASLKDDDD